MSTVSLTRGEHGIARIAIERPERRNAICPAVRDDLFEAVGTALLDDTVRALVLAGSGGHFCAGGDIASMHDLDPPRALARMTRNHRLVRLLHDASKPLVAAVEGYAVGAGAGLALLADTLVAARGARIGFPFFKVGLVPDYGLLHTLPRRVGFARARQLLLRARTVSGPDAHAMGLADELADDGEAEVAARELARELAALPATAFALAKRQLARFPQDLDAALEQEALAQSLCFDTADFAEGRAAFLGKRAPRFD